MTQETSADQSPRITHVSWGHMEIEGIGSGKDFKLYPGGGRDWDWNETGTQHEPGIQPADIKELLAKGAKIVVLSRGMHERLQVCSETLQMLKDKGVTVHIKETKEAVRLYNQLTEHEPVGGLFHSTC